MIQFVLVMETEMMSKEYKCFVCDTRSTEKGIPLLIGETTFSRICLGEKLQEILGDKFIVLVSRNDSVCWSCASYINSFDRYEHKTDIIRDLMASRIGLKYKDVKMSYGDLVRKEEGKPGPSDETSALNVPQVAKRGRKPKRPVGRPPSKKPKTRLGLSGAILKVFACRFCSKKYDTEEEMKAHLTEKHATKFICHICDTSFNTLKKYKTHLKTHIFSRAKNHTCVSCGFNSKDIQTYCRHVCNSNVVSLTCNTCRKLFVEVRKEGKSPSVDCPDCSKEILPPAKDSVSIVEGKETPEADDQTSSKEGLISQEESPEVPTIVSSVDKEPPAHVLSENSSDTAMNQLSPQLSFPPSETAQSLDSVLVKPSESGENMLCMKSESMSGDGSLPQDDSDLNHIPDNVNRKDGESSLMDSNEDTLLKTWDTDNLNPQPMNSGGEEEEDSNDQACLEEGEIVSSNEHVLMRNMYDPAPLSDYPVNSYVKCSGCQEEFELSAIPTHTCFLEHDVLEYSEVDPPSYLKAKMLTISSKNENEDSSMSFGKNEIFDEDMGATFYIKEPGTVFVQESFENSEQPRRRRRIPRIPALENAAVKKPSIPKLQCKTCGMEFTSSSSLREHWDLTGHLREVNLGKHAEVNTFTDKVKKMEMTFKVVKQNFDIKANVPGQNEFVLHTKDDFYKSMFVRNDDGKSSFGQAARDEKECSTCGVVFASIEEMMDHQRFDCLTCLTCNITFLDNKLLKKHYQYTGHSAKRDWRNEEGHNMETHLKGDDDMEENEKRPEEEVIDGGVAEEEEEKKEAIITIATSSEI